jgi:hypothetical protein
MLIYTMYYGKYFKVIEGTNPILLSAPHAFSHRRPSLTLSYKFAEPWTDEIVREVCANTGCWGIMLTEECNYDPNYYPLKSNPYKQELVKIVKENKISKFLDIHGLNDEHEFDVGLFYPSKFFRSITLANEVCDHIDRGTLRGLSACIFRFGDTDHETLGEFTASKLRVPSIQIEVARYIREKQILRNSFIENLSEYLRM